MSDPHLYAQVILPLAVEGIYTYRLPGPPEGRIVPGCRVLVPFGKKRIYTAVVHSLADAPPEGIRTREVLEVLDTDPAVKRQQLQLWDWMASYYMCTPGEVLRAALPSGMRPESESRIRVNAGWVDRGKLDRHERLLYEVVKDQGELTLGDLEMAGVGRSPVGVLKRLVEKGAVEIDEFIRHTVAARHVGYIRLSSGFRSQEALHRALDGLGKAPRQQQILEHYLELRQEFPSEEVPKRELLSDPAASGALGALVRKGILEQVKREELGRYRVPEGPAREPMMLTLDQSAVLEEIRTGFRSRQTVLLHGVASGGKTEIYIHLIREAVGQGKQVLYLLPEISLTTQIIERLRRVFGNRVGVYHSRYSDSERVHVYRNLLGLTDEEPYGVVIGVRSAIFLPFSDLGLVVVDEEHESTYKQQDPAPRYHARDAAQVLALYHNARVLMGTATPSFESLFNARSGKFGYARLKARFGESLPPGISLAHTGEATRKKQMISHFTPQLIDGIRDSLANGEQVILFQNRRGYSNYLFCRECGHIPGCRRCDVSLTLHRGSGKLECHYCGHREPVPGSCPSCGENSLIMRGFGTEKVEDEIAMLFRGVRVGRLDTDAARSVRAYEQVIGDFASGRLDILIGTQMLSKGLDFDNVGLVGVLDADSMLHFPDFRAFERSYQLISQVAGRAGRRSKQGRVIIQTMDPEHPVIRYIRAGDFEGLYREQMEEREMFGYPPFKRLIRISLRHAVPPILDGAAEAVAAALKKIFAYRVFGPQYPPVRKIQNAYIKQVLLKIEREASHERARELLKGVLDEISRNEVYRSVRIQVDVDPS